MAKKCTPTGTARWGGCEAAGRPVEGGWELRGTGAPSVMNQISTVGGCRPALGVNDPSSFVGTVFAKDLKSDNPHHKYILESLEGSLGKAL